MSKRHEEYLKIPEMEWDGKTPLVLCDTDTYFFSEEEVLEHCFFEEKEISSLQLVICEPNHAWEINPDEEYCDILPEDKSVEDMSDELGEAFETLNKLIRETKPVLSWSAGKYRTKIKDRNNDK